MVVACALIGNLPATAAAKVIGVDGEAAANHGSSRTVAGMETLHTPAFPSPQ